MMCVSGVHEFPEEDDEGAHCPEHGVTLLFRGDPITPEDLAHDYPERPVPLALGPVAAADSRPH